MSKNFFYVASANLDLNRKISKNNIYTDKNVCILNISKELMSQHNIKPTTGINLDVMENEKIYTIIERYIDQFEQLKISINLCKIFIKENIEQNEITFEDIIQIEISKIHNLYEYLKKQKDFELIENSSHDKWWYNIPNDNGDIIQDFFLNIEKSNDICEKEKQILILKKLFPKQADIIKRLIKLMNKMDKNNFDAFIKEIYNEKEQDLNYMLLNTIEQNYAVKEKSKKRIKKFN